MTKKLSIDSTWSLFLDRDGVINERIANDYVLKQADFHFCVGALEALTNLTHRFLHVFVVTNQQCVAKGLLKDVELAQIHENMCAKISLSGGKISKVYAAKELKDAANSTRKPLPFMAMQAQSEFKDVDFSKSIMVGDTDSDIEFGQRLGMTTVLIESSEVILSSPDFRFSSLHDFSLSIC